MVDSDVSYHPALGLSLGSFLGSSHGSSHGSSPGSCHLSYSFGDLLFSCNGNPDGSRCPTRTKSDKIGRNKSKYRGHCSTFICNSSFSVSSLSKLDLFPIVNLIDMTILLTGGAGRTTTAIAHRLRQAELPFIVLSRSGGAGTDFDVCRFDWLDATTWSMPFQQVTATGRPPISALYVVVGGLAMPEVATPIMEFIDFAKARGVYRFVLLSQSDIEPGGQNMGLVHHHVVSLEPEVEYVVLRPTWFMGKPPTMRFCIRTAGRRTPNRSALSKPFYDIKGADALLR